MKRCRRPQLIANRTGTLRPFRDLPGFPAAGRRCAPVRSAGRPCPPRRGASPPRDDTAVTSTDPDYEAKENRVLELYAITDGHRQPGPGDPTVVIRIEEFGPLNLQAHRPSSGRRPRSAKVGKTGRGDVGGGRPTPDRTGIRHLMAGYDLSTDRPYDIKIRKDRTQFLAFCRYLTPCTRPTSGSRSCWTTSPTPGHQDRPPGRAVGRGQQRRAGLRPVLRLLAQPDRGPVHRAALLHPRRHRPRHPPPAGQHDPPLHRLRGTGTRPTPGSARSFAEPRPSRGEGCLTRHCPVHLSGPKLQVHPEVAARLPAHWPVSR